MASKAISEHQIFLGGDPQRTLLASACLCTYQPDQFSDASARSGSAWAKALEQHPDGDFVEFVMNGIVQGFQIGFDYHTNKCQLAKQNMMSVKKNPLIVE